jgi:hypothetical protein
LAFRLARRKKANIYRSGPLGLTPWGEFQLPGIAAGSKLYEFTDSYGRPFALIHLPSTAHYTVVFGTQPDGASLVDPEQIDAWVANWGGWLASLSNEPAVVATSVTVETAPDSGARLRREVESNIHDDAPDIAKAMLREALKTYPQGSATIRAWVALTFSAAARAGGKRRTADEIARDLASRLPSLTERLESTGAGACAPLNAQELCEVVRVAYDPAAARLIDEAHYQGTPVELNWSDVGPSAHQADWDGYRHDSGHSVSWSMTGAPRGHILASALARLVAPHGEIARKRVTLLYRPIEAGRAAAIVESDQTTPSPGPPRPTGPPPAPWSTPARRRPPQPRKPRVPGWSTSAWWSPPRCCPPVTSMTPWPWSRATSARRHVCCCGAPTARRILPLPRPCRWDWSCPST